jgi:hypothetical protein
MECTYYKCKTCGFVHQVPDYWSDFNPDSVIEMPHINVETKAFCETTELEILKDL